MMSDATIEDVLSGKARWCVVCGDGVAAQKEMADGAVDAVITDPPYNKRTHKGARAKGGKLIADSTVEFASLTSTEFYGDALRVAKRWCLAFCVFEQIAEYEAIADESWVRTGVWIRVGASPQFTGDRPAPGADAVAIAHRSGRKRWNGGGGHALWQHGFASEEVGPNRGHPTRKPLLLMRELVRLFTDKDEVILDPFAGSGTTGVAAIAEGRRAILYERLPEYAAIARARCEAAANNVDWRANPAQIPLFGGGK